MVGNFRHFLPKVFYHRDSFVMREVPSGIDGLFVRIKFCNSQDFFHFHRRCSDI